MKRLALLVACLAAPLAAQSVPEIPFEGNIDVLKLPSGMYLGEAAGVAINPKNKHLFVFSRTGGQSTVHGEAASRLFEFGADGTYLREIGQGLYGFAFAHTVRFDHEGNLWATDEGTNMLVEFNPVSGRVLMVLGRREESVEPAPAPPPRQPGQPAPIPRPGWGSFNRPTDVTFDNDGNIFVSDGYNNSRVVKIDKTGRWVKTWGERGSEPGNFNTLHGIAADAKGNIYVADRTNRRIQVFDHDGTLLHVITIDVPYTKTPNVLLGAMPNEAGGGAGGGGSNPLAVSGAPWAICITPGPGTQYLYSADAVPGRIYKLTLDGKVVGVLGDAGKQAKEFGWIHEIACPSENELYVAELLNWRVQKLTLHPQSAHPATGSRSR